MRNDENKDLTANMRLLPIAIVGATGFFFRFLGNSRINYKVLISFGELLLVACVFLLLLFVFDVIKKISIILSDKYNARISKAVKPKKTAKQATVKQPKQKNSFFGLSFLKKKPAAIAINKTDSDSETEETASAPYAGEENAEPVPAAKKTGFFAGFFKKPDFAGKSEIAEASLEAPVAEPAQEQAPSAEFDSGLTEIKRENAEVDLVSVKKRSEEKINFCLSVAYIILLIAGVYWCVSRIIPIVSSMLKGAPPDYAIENSGIINTVILILFSAITTIYLKVRNDDGKRSGDKTSHGVLTLLVYTSLIYAAGIAANSILGLSVLKALPWVYCGILAYLILVVAANILVLLLRHNILATFDYSFLFYDLAFNGDGENVFDSEEVREKFSLKSLWTIRYTLGILPGLVLLLGLASLLSTTIYVVQPHQQALLCRLGNISGNPVAGQGLHFKYPWPIDEVHIYDVQRINSMQIGYAATNTKDFIWGVAHDGGEHLLLLGNGKDVVAVNVKINYKIDDLLAYFTTYAKPEDVLSAAAYESIMEMTINTSLDAFLSIDRDSFSKKLSGDLSDFCKAENLGLSVTEVIIQGIHPPISVAETYQKVVTASVDKNTIITAAQSTAQTQIIAAERQRDADITAATVDSHTRISSAQDEMTVYYAAMEAYNVNPECFELSKYIEAYENVIKGRKVYVFSPSTEKSISNFVVGNKNSASASLYAQGILGTGNPAASAPAASDPLTDDPLTASPDPEAGVGE